MTITDEQIDKKIETMQRRAPWLRLGKAVSATSAADVITEAGLDWRVSLHSLRAMHYDDIDPELTDFTPVSNKMGVVRTNTDGSKISLGVVGNKYKVLQNQEVFTSLDTLIDSGEARYCAAGEINDGTRVWMLMEIPKDISIADDKHCGYLMATTGHDGSQSFVVKPLILRMQCINQINLSMFDGRKKNEYTYTLRHTLNTKLSVSEMSALLNLSYQTIDQYSNFANRAVKTQVMKDTVDKFFKRVWPLPSHIEGLKYSELTDRGERRAWTFAHDNRNKAMDIYESSDTQDNIRHTAYGAYQAVVEVADYYSAGGSSRLALRAMTGQSDRIKNKAFNLTSALIAA